MDVRSYLTVLICTFLKINAGEYLFMYLSAICIPSLNKDLFKSSVCNRVGHVPV